MLIVITLVLITRNRWNHSKGRKDTVRQEERECQKCLASMICPKARIHTLIPSIYPSRSFSEMETRVSQVSEGRLGRGEAGDWAKPSSDGRHSPGFQEVQ